MFIIAVAHTYKQFYRVSTTQGEKVGIFLAALGKNTLQSMDSVEADFQDYGLFSTKT